MIAKFESFLNRDISTGKYWFKKFRDLLKFIYFVRLGFRDKYCLQRAADLAYTSLVAMVPTLVVFLSIISSVKFFPQDLEKKIEVFIFKYFIPETSQKLSEQVSYYVQTFADSAATIGVIGSICMLFTVYLVFHTIESNFNSIMNAQRERPIIHKLSAYTSSMVWTALLVGLSFAMESKVDLTIPFISRLSMFYHYALIAGTFTLAYKIIPNVSVQTRGALIGGIATTLLWGVANRSFSDVISRMVNYDKIYGALSAIPLFLLWLYIVWVLVLIGMEITFVSQNFSELEMDFKPISSPETHALKVMERIGASYLWGKNETTKTLLKKLNVKEMDLRKILDLMEKGGLLACVNEKGEKAYTLARHPDHIFLWEIVAVFNDSFQFKKEEKGNLVRFIPLSYVFPEDSSGLSLSGLIASKN